MIRLSEILEIKNITSKNKKEILSYFRNDHPYLLRYMMDEIDDGKKLDDDTIKDILSNFGYEDTFLPALIQQMKLFGLFVKPNEIWCEVIEEGDFEWMEFKMNYKYIVIDYIGDNENIIILSNEQF